MKNNKIFVAGHRGMAGSAIVRCLQKKGYGNLLLRSRSELDLTQQQQVLEFFKREQPDYVFIAAARVGGIHANNTYRAEFIYQNLMIAANVIQSAWQTGVQNLLFLGSSCIYPRNSPQPIKEEYLLTDALEPTNEPYAIAKIAGIKMCENYNRQYGTQYVCTMPTNLFGPNDNYNLENSHVSPALIRKAHEAKVRQDKELVIWGSGNPKREFLYIDDLADACVFIMEKGISSGVYNIGSGEDVTIKSVATMVADVIGFQGNLVFDTSKPDGTPRKLLNIDKLSELGWHAQVPLKEGIALAYQDYINKYVNKNITEHA